MSFGCGQVKAALLGAAFLLALSACSTFESLEEPAHINALAAKQGFSALDIKHNVLPLAVFSRGASIRGDTLVVYIEGDGAPWITPYQPPRDPTPQKPVSLALASADPASRVVYLGRPCQYLSAAALRQCDSALWTERRFAPEIISAYDDALDQIKSSLGVRRLRLIGFSGGGVIATLLAARRDDVEILITVAAPLAVSEWVRRHRLSPLTGSLDPAAYGKDTHLPDGVHFVGGKDSIVPASIVQAFVNRNGGRIVTIDDFDHDCCWVHDWVELLHRVYDLEGDK